MKEIVLLIHIIYATDSKDSTKGQPELSFCVPKISLTNSLKNSIPIGEISSVHALEIIKKIPIARKRRKKYLSNNIIKQLTQKCMMMILFEKYISRNR